MKKLVSFILVLAMLLTLTAAFAEEPAPLQFNADGSFRIMLLADTHTLVDGKPYNEKMTDYLNKAIEANQPDLIILLGDNVHGPGQDRETVLYHLDTLMAVLDTLGLPVAMVFGNHDAEGGATKADQIAIYEKYDCFIGCAGVTDETGVGNYNLPILSSDGSRTAFNLWLFDNGAAPVGEAVLNWYVETSNALKADNGGQPVPSLVFQHAIVSQIFEMLAKADNSIGWALPEGNDGIITEVPCPIGDNAAQMAVHIQQGDVLATVHGHEHENAFTVNYKSIDVVNVPTWSKLGYFGPKTRSITFIDLNESDLWHYELYRVKPQDVGLMWHYGRTLPEQTTITAQ